MQPGNDLFAVYADATYAFITGLAVASIAVLVLGTAGSFVYARIINVPSRVLAPLILVMTVVGSYAIRNNLLDVWVMLIFGTVGLALVRLKYQPAPLVLGIILGPYIEDGLVQSLMIGGASGNVLSYMTLRPISIFLILLCVNNTLTETEDSDITQSQNTQQQQNRGLNSDLIMGLTALSIAAIVWVRSLGLSHFGNVFIRAAACVLLVLAITALIKSIVKPDRNRFFKSPQERQRILLAMSLLAGYVLLIPIAGFIMASILFYLLMAITLQTQPLSWKNIAWLILQAGVVIAILYLLFSGLLQVPLPVGLWNS